MRRMMVDLPKKDDVAQIKEDIKKDISKTDEKVATVITSVDAAHNTKRYGRRPHFLAGGECQGHRGGCEFHSRSAADDGKTNREELDRITTQQYRKYGAATGRRMASTSHTLVRMAPLRQQ